MKLTPLATAYDALASKAKHLPSVADAVRKYAGEGGVTHLCGPRGVVAHIGVVRGLDPKTSFISVSARPLPWWPQALADLGRRFRPRTALGACDLLVLECVSPGPDLDAALMGGNTYARRAIAIVGVEIDRDAKEKTLTGVRTFLRAHPTWVVASYEASHAGVLVLSRDPADLTPIVHGARDVLAFFKAQLTHRIKSGGAYLPLPMVQERIDACLTCTTRGGEAGGNCKACKCYLFQVPDGVRLVAGTPGKVFFPDQACPLGKWEARPGAGVPMSADEVGAMLREAFTPLESGEPPPGTP